jgi:uncharacterized membrane protein YphA (DoxX/SURF4 family)
MALVDDPIQPWLEPADTPPPGLAPAEPATATPAGAAAATSAAGAAASLPAAAAPLAARAAAAEWGLGLRIGFRVCVCYLALYYGVSLVGLIPWLGTYVWVGNSRLWMALVPWVGKHVLHLATAVTTYPNGNGSGDALFDYVQLLCFVALAALGALVWSVLDARRREYRRFAEWTLLCTRYVLAIALLSYGFAKVIKTQFSDPNAARLIEPLGDFSPMGLLWTFMGYSTPYTFFAGAMEVLGGLLLFFRRTATLGALVAVGVMTNVVLLNFCYDVPVKLYSTNLLLAGVFIMAPDLRRLADVLVLDRPSLPRERPELWRARWARVGAWVLKLGLLAFILYSDVTASLESRTMIAGLPQKTPLYGVFDVESFVRGGQLVPPLLTDTSRWRRIASYWDTALTVTSMEEGRHRYLSAYDRVHQTVTLSEAKGKPKVAVLHWSRPDKDHLTLTGVLSGQPVTIQLRQRRADQTPLMSRGFHWINEQPFNR